MPTNLPKIAQGSMGLARYLVEIRRFPILEPAAEFNLAEQWQEHGDQDAIEKLVTSHLRLVARLAIGYRGYGLPIGELIAEGNLGLMKAVYRFDPDKGFRLSTYAMWWIRASIQEYILHSWSLVKMGTTAAQKKLFFNLRRAKRQLQALEEGDLHPDQVKAIARKFGVKQSDVISMNRRLGGDAPLNGKVRADSEAEWQDWLADDAPSQEEVLGDTQELDRRKTFLSNALASLNSRERRILEARRLTDQPLTLQDLSTEYGLSRERIRQIEMRAFDKVQKAVQAAA
jgi:RNA polymerase sigma-32 factor